ncbi:MAG TPA: DNA polymerase III subunit epsilon [Gammaproteobacteria bacterium]|nr:DNA polymerase III subunit epsilon [Gammaproteobacteria bacterium]
MRQIVLDTETTGLSIEEGHRIVEIGCIELMNRKFSGKRFHQYINPEREIDEGALNVHGITQDFLQTKPRFAEIADEFMEFISGAELIIHNAPFDTGFINYELGLTRKKWKPLTDYCRTIDTLLMARQLHVGQRNSLDALCKRYNVDNSQRDLHGALMDAHLLAQVYLAMTGGQGSLFGDTKLGETRPEEAIEMKILSAQAKNLIVLAATDDEMAVHEEKLQKMRENGKCLWLEVGVTDF